MSSNNVKIKTAPAKEGVTITTTSSNAISTSGVMQAVVFRSALMKKFQDSFVASKNFGNFEDLEAEYNEEFKEVKDYFIMKPIGPMALYQSVCISYLSELNMQFDDEVKTKLYSAVILDNKEKIVQIKNNKIMFENIYKANAVHHNMEHSLQSLCDELLLMSESFEGEVTNKISSERTSAEQIKKIQLFISTILDNKNEPMMKNIGKNKELKIKYIKLAHYLLHHRGVGGIETANYDGISKSLINHLSKIISLRELIVQKLSEWIRYLCGDVYAFVHQLEGLKVDQSLLSMIEGQIEYGRGTNTHTTTETVNFFIHFFLFF